MPGPGAQALSRGPGEPQEAGRDRSALGLGRPSWGPLGDGLEGRDWSPGGRGGHGDGDGDGTESRGHEDRAWDCQPVEEEEAGREGGTQHLAWCLGEDTELTGDSDAVAGPGLGAQRNIW